MQTEWARIVQERTKGRVLILAPLAVAEQTVREGEKFGIGITLVSEQSQCKEPGIFITNYHKLEHFSAEEFNGVVLDESSILKHQDSAYRKLLTEAFEQTQYKLACTATPAPNDFMELGNHAEFLGVMTQKEMLAMYFVHDGGETQKWRVKGHATEAFWRWMATWSVCLRKPSDLGYSDEGFILPPLRVHKHIVNVDDAPPTEGMLLALPAASLMERQRARRQSIQERCDKARDLAYHSTEEWLFWCKLNDESALVAKLCEAEEVTGSQPNNLKASLVLDFASGESKRLVSKPELCGFGLNLQNCRNVVFVGMDDSYERYYQAIRRCYRYGQKREVNVHLIISDLEGAVLRNIERKQAEADEMANQMVKYMSEITKSELKGKHKTVSKYKTGKAEGKDWTLFHGDCVAVAKAIPDNSIHYSIFSPPFASLYTYSDSERDMGNSAGDEEFSRHFAFLVAEMHRVMIPGRLVSFHCMDMPTSKTRYGYIGILDFSGELIRAFEKEGFIYHSKVTIWKDPVTAMQRTKAIGLLHKQVTKDSCMSRQGVPDYLITMRKPGDNPEPVVGQFDRYIGEDGTGPNGSADGIIEGPASVKTRFSIEVWQRYASPVWMDIDPGKTLQRGAARAERDERHICPLQLQVIERGLELWSNPGDLVFSPFAGIGSEGYVALKMDRRFIGAELKESYFQEAKWNLQKVEEEKATDLFAQQPKQEPAVATSEDW